MKRILLFSLLVVSLTVFAQQQSDRAEDPKTQADQTVDAEPENKNEASEEPSGAGPRDSDFKPKEEISEDFPVSLPSDI